MKFTNTSDVNLEIARIRQNTIYDEKYELSSTISILIFLNSLFKEVCLNKTILYLDIEKLIMMYEDDFVEFKEDYRKNALCQNRLLTQYRWDARKERMKIKSLIQVKEEKITTKKRRF